MPELHSVVPKITNLLSYAALVFVCFYYIAGAAFKKNNPLLAKKILPLMTTATIVLCLASIGSYVYLQSISTEKIIRGTVYDTNSNPLPNVTVSIPGITNTETNEHGIYVIAIIPKHGEDNVPAIFSKAGYDTINKRINIESRETTELKAQEIDHSKIVTIMSDISIYNVVNLFGIGIKFKLANSYSTKQRIQIYGITISKEEKQHGLAPSASFIDTPYRKFDTPITTLDLNPNEEVNLGLRFDAQISPSKELIDARISCLRHISNQNQTSSDIVSKELVDFLALILWREIFWTPGNYKIIIPYSLNEKYYSVTKSFSITNNQAQTFTNAANYYKSCFGIDLTPVTTYGDAAIMQVVTIE
ncbi:carboxypeptidase-like regulatory domain-containing protein [Desulfovibrio sulfodismutans]|uniref:Carboxypeptidase-like regulatory domain-containing protein n=1 Tax=Desulfolutivibrio sulfodismutans TaxID=63561 RepID=A0A7K3NNL8_9BACT|nr:carboxypeptidase regulatory-like domain-containing protein [Desulfolutivibrio sulfodismutans]NDY57786.1 carboxypeptidase-like regulatory domain-containing protein [Desulfolutivibrio sulfodismutans]